MEYINNYSHAANGRVLLGWNPRRIDVSCIETHAQGIHAAVIDTLSGKTFQLIVVYAYNSPEQRKSLWSFISRVSQSVTQPLLIGGDFNTVLTIDDRLQGNFIYEMDIKDFSECLQENELTPLRMVGNNYTWCNNQAGSQRIYSLIDRCVANTLWFTEFPSIVVEILERGVSDHNPQLLCFEEERVNRNTPFRFLNVLCDHPEFLNIVDDIRRAPTC